MAEEKKQDELTEKELEKASGGRRMARASGEPGAGGRVVANPNQPDDGDSGGSGPTVGDVTPIDDPSFQ